MTVSKSQLLLAGQENLVELGNSLNWGFYPTLDSIKTLEAVHRQQRESQSRVASLCEDIDVDALDEAEMEQFHQEQNEFTNSAIGGIFMLGQVVPKKPKSVVERKQDKMDKRIKAEQKAIEKLAKPAIVEAPKKANAPAKPAVVNATTEDAGGNGIRFTQGGKEVPVAQALTMLNNTATPSQLYEKRDEIFALLEKQKQLSAKARTGKSIDEQRVVTDLGIENQVMALAVRQTYTEVTETAVAQMDLETLVKIETQIMETYGEYMSKQR